jgi:hypothetical protein
MSTPTISKKACDGFWTYHTSIEFPKTRSLWQLPENRQFGTPATLLYKTTMIVPSLFLLISELFVSTCKLTVGNAGIALYNGSRHISKSFIKEKELSALEQLRSLYMQHKTATAILTSFAACALVNYLILKRPGENFFRFYTKCSVTVFNSSLGILQAGVCSILSIAKAAQGVLQFFKGTNSSEMSYTFASSLYFITKAQAGVVHFLSPITKFYHRILLSAFYDDNRFLLTHFAAFGLGLVPPLAALRATWIYQEAVSLLKEKKEEPEQTQSEENKNATA